MKSNKKIGKYILQEEIGRGNFSTVFSAKTQDQDPLTPPLFAIKCIPKKTIESNKILKKLLNTEVSIMNRINHPNIMHLFDYYETNNNYYLVINNCDKGDIENYLRKKRIKYLKEKEAINVLKQIMVGFVELRKFNVIHRDLKLSNIFLHKNKVVIGDFGFAKTGKKMSGTTLGTPLTMAPEMIKGDSVYSSKTDLWSIGIVFYELLFGSPPFFGLSLNELYNEIKLKSGKNLKFPEKPEVKQQTKLLLKKLLQIDPEKRISWMEFFENDIFGVRDFEEKKGSEQPSNIGRDFGHHSPSYNKEFEKSARKYYGDKLKDKSLESSPYSNSSEFERKLNSAKKFFGGDKKEKSLDYSNTISPSQLKTNSVNSDSSLKMDRIIDKMNTLERNKEYFFRYIHEINKANFYLKTCTAIINYVFYPSSENQLFKMKSQFQNSQMKKKLNDLEKTLLYTVLNIVRLSDNLLKGIRSDLLSRENTYVFNKFFEFVKSDKYELLVDLFSLKIKNIKIFQEKIKNEKQLAGYLTREEVKVFGKMNLQENMKNLEIYFLKIYQIIYKQKIFDKNILLITVFIHLCVKGRNYFNYWQEKKKFNWKNFDKNYQNMSNRNLLEILKFSFEEAFAN